MKSNEQDRARREEAFKEMANRGDDQLLDDTRHSLAIWDDQEWEW